MNAPRPPGGITPADFFTGWLPRTWADRALEAPFDTPAVRITARGPDGGDWLVKASGKDLVIADGVGSTPDLWLRQAAADFTATFSSDPDLPVLLPPPFGALDLLFLDPRDGDLVRQVAGRVVLEVKGRRRRRWSLDAAFGPGGVAAGRARATVRIEGPTYEALALGTIAPLKALLERKIEVEGDRPLAMNLCLLLAARLARTR